MPQGTTFSGRVLDGGGSTGLSGIEISLFEADSMHWVTKSATDSGGNFKFVGLNGNNYVVKAGEGSASFPVFYSSASEYGGYGDTDRTLVGGSNKTDAVIRLRPASVIKGAITNGDTNTEIVAFRADDAQNDKYTYVGKVVGATAYNSTGLAVPQGVPVIVQAQRSGYMPAFYKSGQSQTYSGKIATPVQAGTTGVNITLEQAGSITGIISGATGTVSVNVYGKNGNTLEYLNGLAVNAGQTYTLPAPVNSSRVLVVQAEKAGYLKRFHNNTYELDKAATFTLPSTAVKPGVNIALQSAVDISGRITNGANARVSVFEKKSSDTYEYVNSVTANDYGDYTAQILSNIDQVILASRAGYVDRYYQSSAEGTYNRDKKATLQKTASNVINITLQQALAVTGSVKERSTESILGIPLTVNAFIKGQDYEAGYVTAAAVNLTTGAFSMQIPSDSAGILLQVTHNGNQLIGYKDGSWFVDNGSVMSSADARILKGGQSLNNLKICLDKFWIVKGSVGPANIQAVVDLYEWESSGINYNKNKGWVTANASGAYEIRGTGNVAVLLRAGTENYVTKYLSDAASPAWVDNPLDLVTSSARLVLAPENTYTYNPSLALGGQISGTISSSSGGSGVVTVSVETAGGKFFKEVTANVGVKYTIKGVPVGDWKVRAARSNAMTTYYNGAYGYTDAAPITLTTTGRDNIDITLPASYIISGAVSGVGGGVVTVSAFELTNDQPGRWVSSVTKNGGGSYNLNAPTGVSVIIMAESADYMNRFYRYGFTGAYSDEQATRVNGAINGVNITLQEAINMDGRITRLGGSGVVTVNIYQRSGTPGDYAYTYVNQVTVNPSGTSATDYPTVQILKGLPQVAQAMSGGHVDRYYLSGLAGVYDREKATVIDQSGNISGASIVLQPAVTINGGVSTNAGANLGGVTISAYVKNTAFEYVNEVTANTSGLYSISIPANSNTILRAAKSGYAEQWYDRKDVSSNADVLNAARNNVDFKLVQLVTVSGNVSAVSGGGAISGARVAFYTPSDVYVTESFTNNLGEYTTEVPANASYYIQVTTNGTHFPQWYQSAYGYGDRKSYAVSAGNITGLNFGLYTQGALVGTVKDTGGSAIGGVTVSAYVAGSDYTYVHALKTGANGAFSLDVPVGVSLVLQAVTANQFLGFADGSWYYDNTTSVVSSASAKVFTSAQSGLTFVLDRRWKVAGRVTLDPAASPAGARAELYNWPDSGLTWDFRGGVTLDSSGAYEITGTGNAGFQALLRVSLNNYVPAFYKDKNNVNALVTANDRLVVPLLTTTNAGTVTLNLAGGISGTVTALDGSGMVTINVEDLRGNYFTSVTRNGGGAYTVPNLPSGNWLVRAAQDGTVAEYFGETASTANAAVVRVKAGEITNNINISIAKEWTISGKITDQNNSAAISGALVQVYFVTEPNSWFWVASANTDASGEYTLRGGYSNKQNNPTRIFLQISASAAGYTETTTNVIDVAVGQAYTDKNYALEGAAYVRGTVVNVSANTTVTINAFEKGSNFVWVGEITINGNDAASVAYVLPIKANKDLVIRAAASGYEDLWYDQKISSADAETVAQAVGTTKDAVNFNFAGHKRWLISGVIKDTDGLPLGGLSVNVFVRDSDYAGPDGGSVQTGADGRFSLQIAPTKDLVLQASTANPYIGYPTGTYYKENTAGVISSADAASLAYSAGDQDLDFKIARFWLLRGEVTPKDIEAVVDLYEYDGADINWAKNKGWVTANSNGAYEIRGTGNVTVNIRAATGNYIAAGINQTTLRPENTYTHNFNLTLGASISGRVTVNGSGTVTISVQDTDGNWLAFVTRNGTGDYSIPRVPAGARLVYAQKDNCVAEYYGETTSTKNASRLNLAAGQTTDNINIEIDREWTIAGKVETSGGQPVSDAEVDVWRSLSDWDYIGRAKTDSSGQYIVTGGYNSLDVYVRVSVNGYETQYYNDQYTENKANTINMIPGAQKTDVNFILKQVWKISGVVQTDGKGLASVRVVLYEYSNTENIIAETGTNTDGYYELVSSNPVSVDVSIFYAKDAYVTADLKERITVTLGGSPIYKDINMVLLAPPVHPLPPGQSVLDTVRSGPNPADPEKGPIHIGFILDSAARARVKVYTLGGELVFQDDRYFPAGYGEFVWSGANLYDRRLPNGVYLAYVEIDTGQEKLRKVLKIAILR